MIVDDGKTIKFVRHLPTAGFDPTNKELRPVVRLDPSVGIETWAKHHLGNSHEAGGIVIRCVYDIRFDEYRAFECVEINGNKAKQQIAEKAIDGLTERMRAEFRLVNLEQPRSPRFALFGWNLNGGGWSVSIGRLNLHYHNEPGHTYIDLEWIKFKERIWAGWSKTIWRGKSCRYVDENRPDRRVA